MAMSEIDSFNKSPTEVDSHKVFAILLARGYVSFNAAISHAYGYKASIFLCHALYWTRKASSERNGWFWKTAEDWFSSTALTPREQTSVRRLLVAEKILDEVLKGNPAKLFYKVNLEQLAAKLGLSSPEKVFSFVHSNATIYYKSLADLCSSSSSGLLLSWLLIQLKKAYLAMNVSHDGFFSVDLDSACISLGLSEKAQRNARSRLQRAGFISERHLSFGAVRLLVRINLNALHGCIASQDAMPLAITVNSQTEQVTQKLGSTISHQEAWSANTKQASARSTPVSPFACVPVNIFSEQALSVSSNNGNPGKTLTPRRTEPKIPSAQSAKLRHVFPSAQSANLGSPNRPNVETPTAQTSKLSIQNRIHNPPPSRDSPQGGERRRRFSSSMPSAEAVAGQSSGLLMPSGLSVDLHDAARRIVNKVGNDHEKQQLLDELEGHLIAGRPIKKPLAWLNAVVEKHIAGTLLFTEAPVVASRRACEVKKQSEAITKTDQAPLPPAKPSAEILARLREVAGRRPAVTEARSEVRTKI